MRISDWSSDVCSSDLAHYNRHPERGDNHVRVPDPSDHRERGFQCPQSGMPPRPSCPGHRSENESPDNCETAANLRSEEHTSELQSLMRISYAVFCLKKKKYIT